MDSINLSISRKSYLTNEFTLASWIRIEDYSNGDVYNQIVGKWGSTGIASYLLDINNSGKFRLIINDGTDNFPIISSSIVVENEWYYIVGVKDNDVMRLYINGEMTDTAIVAKIPLISEVDLTIGNSPSRPRGFKGDIDDIRIYNRVLSLEEIDALYKEYLCFETIYDTITTEVFDTTYVTINDTLTTEIFDTTYVTVNDTATVEEYDTTYISVTDTLIIDVDFTGFDPPRENNTIKVYPNPTRDHLYIHTGNYLEMVGYSMKIVNNLGAVVFESAIEQELYEVDLSTWGGAGLYVIQLLDSGGKVIESRKIILE